MARKNKNNKKKKRRSGHPARDSRLAARRIRLDREQLVRRFGQWLTEQSEIAESQSALDSMVGIVHDFLATGAEQSPPLNPTALDPFVLEIFLSSISEIADGEEEQLAFALALHDYVIFLNETGSWTGSQASLTKCMKLTQYFLDEIAPLESLAGRVGVDLSAITDEARRGALESTRLVRAVPDLLRWIGAGRDVTATGNLRLADIGPVAAMLGIAVVGRRSRRPAQATLDLGNALDVTSDDAVEVQSLRDAPQLFAWWTAVHGVGLLETTETTVGLGPHLNAWDHLDTDVALAIREKLIEAYLSVIFVYERDPPGALQKIAPFTVHDLYSHMTLALRPDVDPDVPSTSLVDTEFGPEFHQRTETVIWGLEHLGLLEVRAVEGGVRYIVPEGLRPAFLAALPWLYEDPWLDSGDWVSLEAGAPFTWR